MQTTQQSYRARLDRVTAFLHANLETDIGIEALSDLAGQFGHRYFEDCRACAIRITTKPEDLRSDIFLSVAGGVS